MQINSCILFRGEGERERERERERESKVRGKKAKVSDYLNWIKFCLAGFEEILFAL